MSNRNLFETFSTVWRQSPLWLLLTIGLGIWSVVDSVSTSGIVPALAAVAWGFILFGVGCSVLLCVQRAPRPELLLVALAIGLVVFSAVGQFASQVGISLRLLFWASLGVGIPGLVYGGRILYRACHRQIVFGLPILLVVAAIGVLYFLPVSLRSGTSTADGGRQWLEADSLSQEAIVSTVSTQAFVPPRAPNFSQQLLVYHYGRQALAAELASATGISSGDALFRVVQPIGLLALIGVVLAFGLWTSIGSVPPTLTGLFALLIVFFLSNVFNFIRFLLRVALERWASLAWIVERLNNLPSVDYNFHLLEGSVLWAGIVLFLVAGLLIYLHSHAEDSEREQWLLLLTPLCVCLNILAGASLVLVVGAISVWFGWRRWQTWFFLVQLFILTLVSMVLGGFVNLNPDPNTSGGSAWLGLANSFPTGRFVTIYLFFTVALGLRVVGLFTLAWGKLVTQLTLGLFLIGYLGLYAVLRANAGSDDVYSLLFLSILLGGYAAAPATVFWDWLFHPQSGMKSKPPLGVRVFARRLGWLVVLFGIVSLIPIVLVLRNLVMASLVATIVAALLVFLMWHKGSPFWLDRRRVGLIVLVLVVLSLLGPLETIVDVAWQRKNFTIVADAGRITSLEALSRSSLANSIIATKHYSFLGYTSFYGRSMLYAAQSERLALVESETHLAVNLNRKFSSTKSDNDLLFSTADAAVAREIVQRYGIGYIVTEPNEGLGFDAAQATWLNEIPNEGTLGIWKVVTTP